MSQKGLAVLSACASVRPRENWGIRGLCQPQLPLAASFSEGAAVLARPFCRGGLAVLPGGLISSAAVWVGRGCWSVA